MPGIKRVTPPCDIALSPINTDSEHQSNNLTITFLSPKGVAPAQGFLIRIHNNLHFYFLWNPKVRLAIHPSS